MMLEELLVLFSPDQVVQHTELNNPWGNDALYTVYANNESEISQVLTLAHKKCWSVIPSGNGTKKGWGGLSDQPANLCLSLAKMKGIIEHSIGDMTVRVLPGTTMQELNQALGEKGQMIPLDPFWPEQATIAGVIAANDSGPKRLRYGSARDHVIGLRVIQADGTILRYGGQVVKNVAGYDMNKLFIGSMGTLGVITEITLKLKPVPKYTVLIDLSFDTKHTEDLSVFISELLDSHLEAVTLELLNPDLHEQMTGLHSYALMIALEDVRQSVDDQIQWLQEHCPSSATIAVSREQDACDWWERFAALPPYPLNDPPNNSLKISLKIGSRNTHVIELIDCMNRLAIEHSIRVTSHGGLGHGITRAYLQGEASNINEFIIHLRSFAHQIGSYVVIQHAPLSVRQQLPVWDETPVSFSMMKGIKETFDPQNILNHQRFIGGL